MIGGLIVTHGRLAIELLNAANVVLSTATPNTDASGNVSVADVATTTQVRVTDQFGNHATVPVPLIGVTSPCVQL